MSVEPQTMEEAMVALAAAGETVIHVVFTTSNTAAIAVCWCTSDRHALEVIEGLRADVESKGERVPLLWSIPVSDVPRLPR